LIDDEGRALIEGRRRAAYSIAIHLSERLQGAAVATHSASATVREAILHTPPERVICTVSEPVGEGRAFADELRAEGLNVDLVEDAGAPAAMADAGLFLIGADTVFLDGTLCNKIGTTTLAEAAAGHGIPTVVACEIVKLAPVDAAGGERGKQDVEGAESRFQRPREECPDGRRLIVGGIAADLFDRGHDPRFQAVRLRGQVIVRAAPLPGPEGDLIAVELPADRLV